jgi:hypothetical protein
MIKMKLLEMDRVKAVWNKYAANKITGTNIKFRVLNNLASLINEEHQCLLDALWSTRNDGRKFLDSLNALTYYFSQGL